MFGRSFSYNSRSAPRSYRCGQCGKKGVKLWGGYISYEGLWCAECVMERHGESYQLNADGSYEYTGEQGKHVTYTIGWMVPAIPKIDNPKSYWGYGKAPQEACTWWKQLPNS
ncbi:MAG: hypothetical protein PVI21_05380 [Candidatus Woesebacteria bacterium]|jgi:hypothetical protein